MARGGNTFPLTPGQATTVNPPAAGQQYGAVVFQNISPYLCVVSVGVDQYFLAPYMADLFPLVNADGSFSTSQPPTVVPANLDNVSGVSANLTATFYEPGEAPSGGYPVSLASPAAIASETAAALLTTGIPNVLQTKTLLTAGTFAQLAAIDLSGYGSINLQISSNGNTYQDILEFDFSGAGAGGGSWSYQWNDVAGGGLTPGQAMSCTLPVRAAALTIRSIANLGGYTVTAVGSNRPVNDAQFDSTVAINFNASQAWSGQTILSIYGGTNNQAFHTRGGWHYLSAFITGASKGRIQLLQCSYVHAAGKAVSLTDSGEWHTGSDAVATQRIEKTVYIAPGIYGLAWQADVAATYQVDVNLWSM